MKPIPDRPRCRGALRVCLLSLLLAAPSAWAAGSADMPVQLASVSVSATRLFDGADSASEATVYSEQFQYRPLTRPAELMEVVPGLIVTQHSGEGKANQYFLRGFNLDHGTDFASFVDGMPVNLPSHAHGQGYSDLNFLIPELVDSVQYRKGPYYAQYGDFSSAGAADIRYRDRLDAPLLQITGGENGYARLVSAASGHAAGGDWLYGIEGQHYDGPFVLDDNFNNGSGVLRYTHHDESGGFHAEVMAYQAHWDSSDQIPQRAVDSGSITRFGCIDCTDAGSTYRYSLSLGADHRIGEGALVASAYAIRYHLDLYSDFTYFLNSDKLAALAGKSFTPDPQLPTDQFEQVDTRSVFGGQVAYRFRGALGDVALLNETGLQTRFDEVPTSGLYDTQSRDRFFTVVDDHVHEWNGAIYAQSSATLTRWARVEAGLRYDEFHFGVDANVDGNSGGTWAGIASPKLSYIFGPFAHTDFFINLGKGFHSNDARGITQTQQPISAYNPTPQAAQPATPLAASRGLDVGVRTAAVPHLQLAMSLFVLDLDSELTLDGDSGTTGIGPATRREGIETAVFWRPLPHLVLDSDWAYTHSRYRQSDGVGTHIEEAPTSVAALGLTYESPQGWDGALRLRYFGPRPLAEDESISSRASRLVNASLGYRLSPHVHLSLQGTNLLNSHDHDIDYYYASRLRDEAAGGVYDVHFHPVEPIDGRLVLSYRF